MAATSDNKKADETARVRLRTGDGRVFAVPLKAIKLSSTINNMLQDLGVSGNAGNHEIPIDNISGPTFEKVNEWCEHHANDPPYVEAAKGERRVDEITAWDKSFFNVDQALLFEIVIAANYLDIKPLLDLACKIIANMIKGKSTEELRQTFDIDNDFTPQEEEQIRKENAWLEE